MDSSRSLVGRSAFYIKSVLIYLVEIARPKRHLSMTPFEKELIINK
jgi:hypothetical protein